MLGEETSGFSPAKINRIPRIFTPERIGPVELKTRVIIAPMTTRCADREGFVTDDAIAYYRARAEAGLSDSGCEASYSDGKSTRLTNTILPPSFFTTW
jgi:2,4-dienoyl-CoA reductase-like NADH-dependent reductase (Old Yellow Enzyme family)